MKNNTITGVFGILTFLMFIFGFTILILVINPTIFTATDGFMIVGFNVSGMDGLFWTKYFNYLLVGSLLISFCISLLKNTNNRGVDFTGKILLLLSGLIYITFAFTEFDYEGEVDDWSLLFYLFRIILILLLGAIGFLLISDQFQLINNNKIYKRILMIVGIMILINGTLQLIIHDHYPTYGGLLSWFLYFFGMGIIGFSILRQSEYKTL